MRVPTAHPCWTLTNTGSWNILCIQESLKTSWIFEAKLASLRCVQGKWDNIAIQQHDWLRIKKQPPMHTPPFSTPRHTHSPNLPPCRAGSKGSWSGARSPPPPRPTRTWLPPPGPPPPSGATRPYSTPDWNVFERSVRGGEVRGQRRATVLTVARKRGPPADGCFPGAVLRGFREGGARTLLCAPVHRHTKQLRESRRRRTSSDTKSNEWCTVWLM